ncbi:hypothetical protein [Rheinheimera baltica]|jgi:hypothetical protein|uniref:hypothetical protein n=1 Tax=Rheinheimera baltica TaxID=67576 RepID=UPI0003FED5F9|nr:hypothetical protein [Rheinheimera baltica]
MEKTKAFLNQNLASFYRYLNFEDHNIYYYAIEEKITPDNCIETCKALIEGIAKTILGQLDLKSAEVRSRFSNHELIALESTMSKMLGNGEDFQVLYRQAILVLAAFHHSCEEELMQALGKDFFKFFTKLRNRRGDISHGREAPKPEKSSKNLAEMIVQITDIIAFHMLEVLSLIDFEKDKAENEDFTIAESFFVKSREQLEIISDSERNIRDFNDFLDEQYPYEGKIRFSMALYQQYKDDYKIQFKEFMDGKEILTDSDE